MSIQKRTYKIIDIAIFTIIVCVLEVINVVLIKKVYKNELFTLTVTLPVCMIVLMRWKAWAAIPAATGGLVYSLINGADYKTCLIYALGNLFVMLCLLWFVKPGWQQKIRDNLYLSLLFTLTGYLAMCVGRGTIYAIVYWDIRSILYAIWDFLRVEALNGIIALFIILIARKQDGLFESQDAYLNRKASEQNFTGE